MTIGQRVCGWRKAKGFTRKELADELGVTHAAVYHWEKRNIKPRLRNIEGMVSVFGIDMARFYGAVPKAKVS